ncbi:MAG: hypothetical protein H8E98_08125 [Bacteroidetes bacterium]|nr:hypothetical protein [Bacteroidota bacterium]
METKLAKVISYLFHPLFIPTYAFLLMFAQKSYLAYRIPFSSKLILIFMVVSLTLFLPLILIYFLKKWNVIKDLNMEDKEDRIFPYVIYAVFYYSNFHLFSSLQLPIIYSLFMLGATIISIFALIINFWWKISIHMLAIGGLTAMFFSISILYEIQILYLILLLFFISGLVGFARLRLSSHKQFQVYFGFVAGFLIMLVTFFASS